VTSAITLLRANRVYEQTAEPVVLPYIIMVFRMKMNVSLSLAVHLSVCLYLDVKSLMPIYMTFKKRQR